MTAPTQAPRTGDFHPYASPASWAESIDRLFREVYSPGTAWVACYERSGMIPGGYPAEPRDAIVIRLNSPLLLREDWVLNPDGADPPPPADVLVLRDVVHFCAPMAFDTAGLRARWDDEEGELVIENPEEGVCIRSLWGNVHNDHRWQKAGRKGWLVPSYSKTLSHAAGEPIPFWSMDARLHHRMKPLMRRIRKDPAWGVYYFRDTGIPVTVMKERAARWSLETLLAALERNSGFEQSALRAYPELEPEDVRAYIHWQDEREEIVQLAEKWGAALDPALLAALPL